jgi:hypothetical protein
MAHHDDQLPATKGDVRALERRIESVEERMATKDDLKKFATKDDLKRFATKDDLKRFATKDDLKRFATKEDLESRACKTEQFILVQFEELKHDVLGALQDVRSNDYQLANHEERLRVLEARTTGR